MLDELRRIELYKQSNPNELSSQQFLKLQHEIENPRSDIKTDEYVDFKLWCNGLSSRQESFANYIAKKLSGKEGAKILEVGCGRTARLSRFLSEKGFCMTCIDSKLEISTHGNIEFIKKQFDYKKFDLTKYDYVIAQEPCEATEHIIRACLKQKVPFMIILCGAPHKLISGKKHKDVMEWYDYLINISSEEIRFRYIKLDPFFKTPTLRSNKF